MPSNATELVSWRHCEVHTRSTFSILSLCLSTLVICVWNAVHHNVPNPHTPRWKVYLGRFEGVLVGLFLPEVLVLNALDQFMQARGLLNAMRSLQDDTPPASGHSFFTIAYWIEDWRHNVVAESDRPQWTMSHAYYAIMHGFVTKSNSGSIVILSPREIVRLCKYDSSMRRCFEANGIEDHSKAGAIAKALFCWQLLVFTISCVARRAEKLPLSLLEITTLAHSLCGLAAFSLWWDKPHSVDEVIVVSVGDAHEEIIERVQPNPRDQMGVQGMEILMEAPKYYRYAAGILSPLVVTALYGLPHLLALSTEFPTLVERRFWQGATTVIIGTPLITVATSWLRFFLPSSSPAPIFNIMTGLFILYVAASCFIVAESLRQLFALPSRAFLSPVLVCYLPHFS